jgi:FtsP/CotA-like multicopper oxidase with cupredoxin domain
LVLRRLVRVRLVVIVVALAVIAAGGGYLVFGHRGPPPQARTFTLSVTDGKESPETIRAFEGDTVTIKVIADKDEEIHLHGYDKHFMATVGVPVTQTFRADKTGSFEIEIEDTSQHLGFLEVDPR